MAEEMYQDPYAPLTPKERRNPTFGKIMLASAVGALIALVAVGLFKLLMMIGLIGSIGSTPAYPVAKHSFLKIDLTQSFPERTPSDLSQMLDNSGELGFADMLRCIEQARTDSHIDGIYLYMGSLYGLSWGQSAELRTALQQFRDSKKPVWVYADGYSQQGYFVASVADSIFLNPSGMVEFKGIGSEALFFKEMLDRLAVKMTLIRPRSNAFKSAGERYTLDHMSESNRTQVREYIGSIWRYALECISESRGIGIAELNVLADSLAAVLPNDALSHRLADRLCFESDILASLKEHYECPGMVTLNNYNTRLAPNGSKDRIAIIYAEGDVVSGSGFNTAVYSDKITRALNDAADDNSIKAIVLRINSPGGMVTASEIMTNAVARAKEKKPVVVSMSDVAASAGYEIACNADCIVAQPTTLTGSIGVFATLPEVGGTLKRYLGITTDTAKTNANATALSIMRPLSPQALQLMQRNVEEFYTVFVSRVAKGRNLEYSFVDSIARGRVWTGRDAQKLGLVDTLGGLNDAIRIAAQMAKTDKYATVDYPANDNLLTELMNRKSGNSGTAKARLDATRPLPSPTPSAALGDGVWVSGHHMISLLNHILETQGLQARVEFFLLTD